MSKEMMQLDIKLWEAEHDRCLAEEMRTKKIMDEDPTTMLLDCHKQLNDLLKKYQGKERLTPQFKAEVDKLARKEKRAKHLQKKYDMMKAMDASHAAKMLTGEVARELNNRKFSYKFRYEKNEKKREAMIVEDIIDKVSK